MVELDAGVFADIFGEIEEALTSSLLKPLSSGIGEDDSVIILWKMP